MNTGKPKLDERSMGRLLDPRADKRLANLFIAVCQEPDCPLYIITEVLRTQKRQIELLAAGASRTLNSKHLIGKAADAAIYVGNEVRWDWPLYVQFAKVVKRVAEKQKLPLAWGGDWKKFKDGPHFELLD